MHSTKEGIEWPEFLEAYGWMMEQMVKRLPDFSGYYPIWAWPKRPDLRSYGQDFSQGSHVLLTLEVPEDRVLLSDFNGWHFILNGRFLALTEMEDEEREKLPPTSEEIRQSWEYIFDPEKMTPWVSTGKRQACVDQVYLHEVVEVRPIKTKGRVRKG